MDSQHTPCRLVVILGEELAVDRYILSQRIAALQHEIDAQSAQLTTLRQQRQEMPGGSVEERRLSRQIEHLRVQLEARHALLREARQQRQLLMRDRGLNSAFRDTLFVPLAELVPPEAFAG